MNCPHCGTPNPEGVSICEACLEPLTAYGGEVTGIASQSAVEAGRRLAVRPAIVPFAVALDVATALAGPIASVAGRFSARPQVNQEATNYLSAAFGALGVTFYAAAVLPVAIVLLLVAWGCFTQQTWAWKANAAVLVAGAVWGLTHMVGNAAAFICLVAFVVIGVGWFRGSVREWYGARKV